MTITFRKAVKFDARARVALIGPAGSGKSFTMLRLARLLAGPEGRIAAVDTEHGSLSKYADQFEFDVFEMESFSPENFLEALRAAEAAKYDVFCCDSLSHFWVGRDGALEFVDTARKRSQSRDDMAGWKEFRPHERGMVDAMISSPMHVICTMRTKTAYEEQVNERTGKKQRVKIGLAPVQREGLEYEFDLVGCMDEENNFVVDKSRCSSLAGKVLSKPSEREFQPFLEWLRGAARPEPAPAPVTPPRIATGNGNGHAANNGNGHKHAAAAGEFKVDGSRLTCVPREVLVKETAKRKPYRSLVLNGAVEGKTVAFCWHESLFEALSGSQGKRCQFETELSNQYLTITDVLSIDGLEYRDGKPWVPPQRGDADESLFITDDDIPF